MYVRSHPNNQNLINQGPSANSEEDLNSQACSQVINKSKSTKTQNIHKSKKNRDSGILTDLFHLNGSVSSLKSKLTSATHSLRKSLSTFNLRSLSIKKSRKKAKLDEPVESDLEPDDNEFRNSEDNLNSPSEDDEDNYDDSALMERDKLFCAKITDTDVIKVNELCI